MDNFAIKLSSRKFQPEKSVISIKAENALNFFKNLSLKPREYLTFKNSSFYIVNRSNYKKVNLIDSNEKEILKFLASVTGTTVAEITQEKKFLAAIKKYQQAYNTAIDKKLLSGCHLIPDSKAGQKTVKIIIKYENILNPEEIFLKKEEFDEENYLKTMITRMSKKSIIYPSKLEKKMPVIKLKKLLTYIASQMGKSYDDIKNDGLFEIEIKNYQTEFNLRVIDGEINVRKLCYDGYAGHRVSI